MSETDAGGMENIGALLEENEKLARAWQQGYTAGWDDGVDDANEDEPGPQAGNPYLPKEK